MANTITAKEMITKSPSEKRRFIQGLSVLKYGLAAFAALAGEAVIAYGIEQNIYGIGIEDLSTTQMILHWVLTYILWGVCGYFICRLAKKKGYDIFEKTIGISDRGSGSA